MKEIYDQVCSTLSYNFSCRAKRHRDEDYDEKSYETLIRAMVNYGDEFTAVYFLSHLLIIIEEYENL